MSKTQPANRSKQQQAQHTPGPWEQLIDGKWIKGSDGRIVARTYRSSKHNAHLISAAPELLAALKRMVETYREGVQDDREPMMVRQAIAAIAKCEGR